MPVGIDLRGVPGTGNVPGTMRPGAIGMPPPTSGPNRNIDPTNARDNSLGGAFQSGSPYDHGASVHANNMQAVRAAMGFGSTPLSGFATNSTGGFVNPFNMPLTYAPGTAGFFVRDTAQTEHQIAAAAASGRGRAAGSADYIAMRRMADYENRDHDLRNRRMRQQAEYENRAFDRSGGGNLIGEGTGGPPGSGGGGGTAGGGGNRGGGLGGALPFAGMLGLGSTSRLLTAGVELGIAGKVIEELAFLPQHILGVEGAAMGNAMPYWNYRTQAAGMGRAGGFAGEAMSKQFYQGVESPEWMQRLGLGPQQSLDLLQNFGILPSNDQAQRIGGQTVAAGQASKNLVQKLAELKFMPAFGGLPEGSVEASAGLFAKYGIFGDMAANPRQSGIGISANIGANPAGQVSQYSAQMVDVIARAQELGLNRAAVMRSIDTTLQTAVTRGGGIAYTPQSIGNELMRYSALPGGRTGEVGMGMIAAASAFGRNVGVDALPTIAYSGLAQRLQSESDIAKYTEKTDPGFMEKIKSNPASAKLLQEYIQARREGNMPAAAQLLSNLFDQSTSLPSRVVGTEGAAGSFAPGYQRDMTVANSLNKTPLEVIAAGLPQGGPSGVMNRSRAEQARAFYRLRGWSVAASTGIAGYYAEETGGNFDPRSFNAAGGGQGAQGMGQWRGDRIAAFTRRYGHGPRDPNIPDEQLRQEQLDFGDWELKNSPAAGGAGEALKGATTGAQAAQIMVDKFGRPGADTPQAERNAAAYANRMDNQPDFSGLPEGMLRAQSQGQAGILAGSQVSAAEAVVLIPLLNKGIQTMIDGLAKGLQIINDPMMQSPTALGSPS